jgi:hypothetical protein
VFSKFFLRKSCLLWDNVEKFCRSGQATDCNMGHAHCIFKVTNTHSEYVTLTAFPLQQWLHERASVLSYSILSLLLKIWKQLHKLYSQSVLPCCENPHNNTNCELLVHQFHINCSYIVYLLYVYVFMYLFYVYVLIVCLCIFTVPAGTLRLPWLRFFRAFSSVVRQMPEENPQRWDTVRLFLNFCVVLYVVFFCVVLCTVCV